MGRRVKSSEEKEALNKWHRERYRQRKEDRICTKCGSSTLVEGSNIFCNVCYKKDNSKGRSNFARERARNKGFCTTCRVVEARKGQSTCFNCANLVSRLTSAKKLKLSLVEYDEIMKPGRCDICNDSFPQKHWSPKGTRLGVDHCHLTGRVRGLLCGNCNSALGLLKEDPIRMVSMIKYIKEKNGTT